ncbi:hypothetical protein CLV63_117116 [Murinocardiopsis flavida]|uniref:Uncharacterized protein n=1 Tax=Murinocardiopsis flavida TaxID=645275 RepID=A0A2P8D6S9_9ACTN|nr:hypothetical protein [Murinocardiopsis flavida]PSK92907.1 hypothetical protein CLV63_117116 [Murinocardiopsis flavida]
MLPPGGAAPPDPGGYPASADASTQNIAAVGGAGTAGPAGPDGATQNISAIGDDEFGGLQMFRDEGSGSGVGDTAQIDISGFDDLDDRSRHAGSSSLGRMLLYAGGFVLLLGAAGTGAYLFASGGLGTGGGYDANRVANESADTGALTIEELFPEKEITLGGEAFTLVNTDETDKCDTAANGDFGAALTENECRQVVRASYVNEDKSRAVTIGVAAMSDADNATAVEEAMDLESAQYFAGLRGKEGSGSERLATAGGHANGSRWGRYVVFSLAANDDGRTPQGTDAELAETGEDGAELPLAALGERAKG